MKTDSSSQRFSQAIFSLALENNAIDTWLTNFNELEIITSNMELISLLDRPDLDIELKTKIIKELLGTCLLYTSPSPRDGLLSRMPSSA